MMIVNLSVGRVACTIVGETALPAAAYPIVAELAEAVEAADRKLADLDKAEPQ